MTPSEKVQKVLDECRQVDGHDSLLPKLAKALEMAVLAIWREDPDDVEGYLREIAEILEGE